jgi:hypothetical protein
MIEPEMTETVEVVLTKESSGEGMLVNFAHSRCYPSHIQTVAQIVTPEDLDTSWMQLLRSHVFPAVLLWELCASIRSSPGLPDETDPMAQRLRAGGFRSATDRLGDLVAPVLTQWSLSLRGDDLILLDPDGNADEFYEAADENPPGWLEAVDETRRCLVVYADGFGLERPNPQRFDRVCQMGEALAGLIPFVGRN